MSIRIDRYWSEILYSVCIVIGDAGVQSKTFYFSSVQCYDSLVL